MITEPAQVKHCRSLLNLIKLNIGHHYKTWSSKKLWIIIECDQVRNSESIYTVIKLNS